MGISAQDQVFMQQALLEAEKAEALGEVPVGAVIVQEGTIIARGHNQPISSNDPSSHAEINAMRRAGECLNNYRLLNTTLYVTLEPCTMCIGAMIHARVKRLVFGAHDPKAGAVESLFQIPNEPALNHHLEIEAGVLAEPCAQILKDFFRARR